MLNTDNKYCMRAQYIHDCQHFKTTICLVLMTKNSVHHGSQISIHDIITHITHR